MTLHDRIENWRRWVLSKGAPYRQANSLEGNYRSPQHWHPEGPRPVEVWRADAELLEAAWRAVRPLESAQLIRLHHLFRKNPAHIRRIIRNMYGHNIAPDQYDGEVAKAECRFQLAIEERERVTRVHEIFVECA